MYLPNLYKSIWSEEARNTSIDGCGLSRYIRNWKYVNWRTWSFKIHKKLPMRQLMHIVFLDTQGTWNATIDTLVLSLCIKTGNASIDAYCTLDTLETGYASIDAFGLSWYPRNRKCVNWRNIGFESLAWYMKTGSASIDAYSLYWFIITWKCVNWWSIQMHKKLWMHQLTRAVYLNTSLNSLEKII